MRESEKELTEVSLLILYIVNNYNCSINVNTFKRYLYLYYISSNFLNENSKETVTININKSKTEVSILGLSAVLNELEIVDFIKLEKSDILIKNGLINRVDLLLKTENGIFFEKYKQILPFINLLYSYEDDYVFTIFFSEPTIDSVINRNKGDFSSDSSILVKWLMEFKKQVKQRGVNNYDILSHWIEFVLEKYYKGEFDGE
ncbi:hypothetical protein GIX45_17075 [Erwinia sp. CPCC 100877]|nr:hypothetical protein [Erwinia sp. CPCC 100877]